MEPALNPEIENEFVVVVAALDHKVEVEILYSTLYAEAPETADQLTVALVGAKLVTEAFKGAGQLVAKFELEKMLFPEEQELLTCQSYTDPKAKPVNTLEVVVVVAVPVQVDDVASLYSTV